MASFFNLTSSMLRPHEQRVEIYKAQIFALERDYYLNAQYRLMNPVSGHFLDIFIIQAYSIKKITHLIIGIEPR